MTDDLVQRLRRTYLKEYAPTGSMVGDISNRLRPFPILATELLFNPDGREAADAIEALQDAVMAVVDAVRDYLPPDGISEEDFISRVIGAVDNPTINPVIFAIEATLQGRGDDT